jgi:hypothetical protein
MNDPFAALSQVLADVVVPNLQAVQQNQAEQIAANDRLELAIEDLRTHLESQFALLAAQLTACQAELAATQAELIAVQTEAGLRANRRGVMVH